MTAIWTFDDGGRAKAVRASGVVAYRGSADDCVTRAIAIATEMPYDAVYALVNEAGKGERSSAKRRGKRSTARTGVYKPTTRRILAGLGWRWTPTMTIGSGCKVHLRADELPAGRLIVAVSKHLVAVIDGVIHDTEDCSRDGTRCVYGYWSAA